MKKATAKTEGAKWKCREQRQNKKRKKSREKNA